MKHFILIFVLCAYSLGQSVYIDGTGTFGCTKADGSSCVVQPAVGSSLPGICSNGNLFFSTTAPLGWYICQGGSWQSALSATRIVGFFNSGTCSGYLKSDGTCDTPTTSIPSGLISMIVSGTCPTGWTEVSALNGKMLKGTVAANGDVGTTGGNATITPTGTVTQPTLTMNAYTPVGTVSAPTFTGSQGTTSATSAGTPVGTNSIAMVATTSGSKAGSSTGAFTAIGGSSPGSSFTVPAETFTGSAMATHTHTLTPTGTNSASTFTGTVATLTGTVSQPTFTGNAIDLSPSYLKVIFCSKN